MAEPIELYDHNTHIDSLYDELDQVIKDRATHTNLTYMEVIGTLNRLIYKLNQEMDE